MFCSIDTREKKLSIEDFASPRPVTPPPPPPSPPVHTTEFFSQRFFFFFSIRDLVDRMVVPLLLCGCEVSGYENLVTVDKISIEILRIGFSRKKQHFDEPSL